MSESTAVGLRCQTKARMRDYAAMDVEPVDLLGAAVLGLAARCLTHRMLDGWLQTPNATFGGRRPMEVWAQYPMAGGEAGDVLDQSRPREADGR